jgi:hypothetical protein
MSWFQRLRNTFRPERVHSDIDREISFHIAERTDQLRSEGMSGQEAARRARLQFGSVRGQAERTRDMDISLWVEGVFSASLHDPDRPALVSSFRRLEAAKDEPQTYTSSRTDCAIATAVGSVS